MKSIPSASPLFFQLQFRSHQVRENDVKKILKQMYSEIQVLPRTRKAILQERLRTKVAEDIVSLMGEQGVFIEGLAKKLKLRNSEMKAWIWTRDLKLSELSELLDALDSEFYPLIRSRTLRRDI